MSNQGSDVLEANDRSVTIAKKALAITEGNVSSTDEGKMGVSISDLVGAEDDPLWRRTAYERRISADFKASLTRPSILRKISVLEMDEDDDDDGSLDLDELKSSPQAQDPPMMSPSTKVADSGFTSFGISAFLGIITATLYLLFFYPVITVVVVTSLIASAKKFLDYKYYNNAVSKKRE